MKSTTTAANITFAILGCIIMLGAAVELAYAYPHYRAYRLHLADTLATQGTAASGSEAVVDLQLATWLNPDNHQVHLNLAQSQLANGQSQAALDQLAKAGQSAEVSRLKVRTLLELGQLQAARAAATDLVNASNASANDIVLACLTYAANNQPADCEALTTRLATPEDLQSVRRAQQGNLPLAAELFATGLQKSSSAILQKLPTSFERNLMLGRIGYQDHTITGLAGARTALEEAIVIDPSSISAHQLLGAVYRDMGDIPKATAQETLASKLVAGRP